MLGPKSAGISVEMTQLPKPPSVPDINEIKKKIIESLIPELSTPKLSSNDPVMSKAQGYRLKKMITDFYTATAKKNEDKITYVKFVE